MDIIQIYIYAFWNILVFAMFGTDKLRLKRNQHRTKDRTFIICAYMMGALGAISGMYIFDHKTRETDFLMHIILAVFANAAVLLFLGRIIL